MITTISKGQQITIPAEIRQSFKLKAGSKIEIEVIGKNIVMKPLEEDLETLFEEAKKRKPKKGLSIKEMEELNERAFR